MFSLLVFFVILAGALVACSGGDSSSSSGGGTGNLGTTAGNYTVTVTATLGTTTAQGVVPLTVQ
jgi:hypothetical protein